MNLEEFLEGINKMVKEDPSLLKLKVINSDDAEGNSYSEVDFSPSLGIFEDYEFNQYDSDITDEDDDEYINPKEINSICIN